MPYEILGGASPGRSVNVLKAKSMSLSTLVYPWLKIWFGWVDHFGLWGVFVLMAMESSIIPVPSEVVLPPAAYWAEQGRMNFTAVILAGTIGSVVGSLGMYGVARHYGQPLVDRWGRYVGLSPSRLHSAEGWVRQYGSGGVLLGRFLPVVRHVISVPAGILKMPLIPFLIASTLGALGWCTILCWCGAWFLGAHPQLLDSPGEMVMAFKQRLHGFLLTLVVLAGLFGLLWALRRHQAQVGNRGGWMGLISQLFGRTDLTKCTPGTPAPDFATETQDGRPVALKDFLGVPLLLYFYPKDGTPGCTQQACALREDFGELSKFGVRIFGVSNQDADSHRKFKAKQGLPFDLLVDPEGKLAAAFGVGSILGFYRRQSVLIGPDQKIVRFYDSVNPTHHSQEVLKDLRALLPSP